MSAAPDDDPVAPQTYDWKLFVRLLGYLRPYKKEVATAFLLIIAMAGRDLVGPYLTKVAIDRYIANGDAGGLAGVAALFFLALVAAFAVGVFSMVVIHISGPRVKEDMRRDVLGDVHRVRGAGVCGAQSGGAV